MREAIPPWGNGIIGYTFEEFSFVNAHLRSRIQGLDSASKRRRVLQAAVHHLNWTGQLAAVAHSSGPRYRVNCILQSAAVPLTAARGYQYANQAYTRHCGCMDRDSDHYMQPNKHGRHNSHRQERCQHNGGKGKRRPEPRRASRLSQIDHDAWDSQRKFR